MLPGALLLVIILQRQAGTQGDESDLEDSQGASSRGRLARGARTASRPSDFSTDPEADDQAATVADHLAYEAKRKILKRFSVGVAAFLISEICKWAGAFSCICHCCDGCSTLLWRR